MTALLLYDGAHHWWGGGIVFFILALIIVFLLVKFVFFRGWWGGPRFANWPDTSPEAVLKRRLAGGEINEADYERLLGLLRK